MSIIISDEQKNEIVNFYKEKPMSLFTVKEKFGYCLPTIRKILNENNCELYSKQRIFNPEFNENYFEEINNEYNAYFLGLIIADGCVFVPKDNRQASISITLNKEDDYILKIFKDKIHAKTNIVTDKRNCSNFAVRSNKIAADLEKYGVVQRKSFVTFLPNIDDNYMPHLLRGILDGDGCVRSNINKNNKHVHTFSFTGSHKICSDIKEYLEMHLKLNNRKIYNYKTYSIIAWNSINDVYKIGEFLYENSTIKFKRKHDKYLDFKEHYNL